MSTTSVAASLLAGLLLVACASPYSRHEAASIHGPVVYSCEDGLSLRVRFAPDGAHVTLPSGEQVILAQRGGHDAYASAQHELTGAGDTATWKTGPRTPVACRVQR